MCELFNLLKRQDQLEIANELGISVLEVSLALDLISYEVSFYTVYLKKYFILGSSKNRRNEKN